MPNSKAQKQAVKRYVKNNYDLFQVTMRKGMKEKIIEYSKRNNQSINGYIINAIEKQLQIDSNITNNTEKQ